MVYDSLIRGKTIIMRSVEERDTDVTYRMRTDLDKTRYIHSIKGTINDQANYIKEQREREGDYLFLIMDLDERPIGMKGLYNWNKEKREVESGRFIGFGNQVQNIEALLLSFDFAFEILEVEKIHMSALSDNIGMLGIQKKFGAVCVSEEPSDEFSCNNVNSILTKDNYEREREKIEKLINRFARRQEVFE